MRKAFVAGNWKMNGTKASLSEAAAISVAAGAHAAIDVAICPPFTLLAAMVEALPDLMIGAQDCHAKPSGAYTGSISAPMLVDAGAKVVIVGHSERRGDLGESDSLVQAKAAAALEHGLSVILCVGEPLDVREAGGAVDHVLRQVAASLPPALPQDARRLSIAYEPIWAIGTGKTATIEDIAEMHAAIRGALGAAGAATRLLYGGSVTADNAAGILGLDDVDGALVGGASLTAEKFVPIIAAAAA